MPYSLSSYTTGEVNARNADNPIIVPRNVLENAIDARWTSNGQQGGSDITLPTAPAYRAFDGRGSVATRADGTLSTVYLNVRIPPTEIDSCAIIFPEVIQLSDVTVQIADAGTFGGGDNVATFASFTGIAGRGRRVRAFNGNRYANVEYIRIRFDALVGNYAVWPRVGEFFVGRGRVLSYRWAYGADEGARSAEVREFVAKSGDTSRYVHHFGRKNVEHSQIFSSQSHLALDDITSLRTMYLQSSDATRPWLYIPRPSSALSRAYLGFVDEGVNIPETDFDTFEYDFVFREQPPYRDGEP